MMLGIVGAIVIALVFGGAIVTSEDFKKDDKKNSK